MIGRCPMRRNATVGSISTSSAASQTDFPNILDGRSDPRMSTQCSTMKTAFRSDRRHLCDHGDPSQGGRSQVVSARPSERRRFAGCRRQLRRIDDRRRIARTTRCRSVSSRNSCADAKIGSSRLMPDRSLSARHGASEIRTGTTPGQTEPWRLLRLRPRQGNRRAVAVQGRRLLPHGHPICPLTVPF